MELIVLAKSRCFRNRQMCDRTTILLLAILGFIMGFSRCGRADDVDSIERYQPQDINFSHGKGGTIQEGPSSIFPEYEGYGYRRVSTRKDEPCAAFEIGMEGPWPRASLKKDGDSPLYPANSWLRQRAIEKCREETGPFYKDDIVPVFGALYRVTRIDSELPDDPQGASIHLSKMGRAEWPAGVTLDPFAYAITPGGSLSIPHARKLTTLFFTPSLKLKYDDTSKSFSLTIFHDLRDRNAPIYGTSMFDGKAWREDDVPIENNSRFGITVGREHQSFRVVSIVPPNRDKHIPGWVEVRRIWPRVTPFGTEEE